MRNDFLPNATFLKPILYYIKDNINKIKAT